MSSLPMTSQDLDPSQNRRTSASTTNGSSRAGSIAGSSTFRSSYSTSASLPPVLKRLFKSPKNLDFETAIWEMIHLITQPRKAFRSFYYQHQTKNQWARDDPSFFILQVLLLSIASIAWSIAYGDTFGGFLKLLFNMIFVDFFLVGFLITTAFWIILNRPFFKFKTTLGYNNVEWAYCFDVHCNAFLIIWVLLYLVQFLLLPVINLHNWIGLIVGNSLYCFAIGHYFILTFYGYTQLPFLKNINFILFPTLTMTVLYVISLVGIDLSAWLSFYNYSK
ncbi:hypothetical protein NCAS_0B07790 [Naumovozyma castellii]|uniref:UNC-50 n=1 Tax=Naumovozyma castellii TaxID=27288 RepID=G0VAD3_NAUCA|nr:hypothetical protein NCAS_0B07790 [Naumovozyma castellii CBS 4309]CCC68863.1 hypothetical protein NCAS_0B07790 [Naumovozyma castellii CBS 4309]